MTPDRRHLARLWDHALTRFEYKLLGQAGKARNNLITAAAKAYVETGHPPNHLFADHRAKLKSVLAAHYRAVVPHFADMTHAQIRRVRIDPKGAEDQFQALMAEWVSTQALSHAKMIAGTDRDDILSVISRGVEDGLGTAEVARNIRAVSGLTPARASTVARTETHQAATFASHASAEQAQSDYGVRLLKEWLPVVDARTRPDHAAMVAHPPIPLDEQFVVGGVSLDRPGDPSGPPEQVISCRCALAYREAD